MRPQITATCVIAFGSTSPFPIVCAPAVVLNAPRKFSPAAIKIACHGCSTRVAITVAIAFAVSWKPLMKSKVTAKSTTTPMSRSPLSMLDGDALEGIGDVLAAVRRVLELLVDLFPAHQIEHIAVIGQDRGERRSQDAIGVVLEPVHLDDVLPNLRVASFIA